MTGADHFSQILAMAERMAPPMPDVESRQRVLLGMVMGAVLQQSALLLRQHQYDVANDLILLADGLVKGAFTKVIDRELLEDSLHRLMNGPKPDDNKIIYNVHDERVAHADPNALSGDELAALGLPPEAADITRDEPEEQAAWRFVAFGSQVPNCVNCGAPAVACVTGVEVGSDSVVSSSLCEACANLEYQACCSDPELQIAGNILYVRKSDASTEQRIGALP